MLFSSLGALSLGCSGDLGPEEMMDTGAGAGVGAGATGAGASGGLGTGADGGVGGSGGSGAVTDPKVCVQGIPGTSQVPRIKNRVYDNIVKDVLGVTEVMGGPPSQSLVTDSIGDMDRYMWNAYQDVGAAIAADVISSDLKANFMACDPAVDATCYQTTIEEFGRKVFRRPMKPEEVERFMGLTTITPQGTPEEISEAILNAFLVSPSFILVPEVGTEAGTAAGSFKLTSHEVAARLALSLWGSVPDADLTAAADAGLLSTPEQLLEQAQRMVQDREKTGRQLAAGHEVYLKMDDDLGHWWKPEQDQTMFPAYNPATKPLMRQEIDAIVEDVAFSGGAFKELFTTNVAYVNADTAPYYDLNPADFGPELTRVELDPETRPGILTRAGFLSSFSSAQMTSPILRGAFITVNVLGVNPGAPDPTVAAAGVPTEGFTTVREAIEDLTAPPGCATCHGQLVNPPGYVLEAYNAIGQMQTVDALGGGAIDTTADVTINSDTVITMSTAKELMEAIVANAESQRLYVQRLVSFATGRLPNSNDACIVSTIDDKLTAGGYTLLNLLTDLTQTESFTQRTIEN